MSEQTPNDQGDTPNPLQEEVNKWKNDYLYLRAEFDNFRKNAVKERVDLLKYGGERLAASLLEILDNFERALATPATPESLSTYVKGIELTATELKAALQKFGVQEVDSLGKAFDPAVHEALAAEESRDYPEGHVLRVFKKPYKYHDKLLRPGQVVVAKAPTTNH